MKRLFYKIEGYTDVYNPETEKVEQRVSLADVTVECATQDEFDVAYSNAKEQAVGEIIVEGEFDTAEPTDAERIAELEEALDMLLSGVTE